MSFTISKNPTFTHDVKVKVPTDGGYETQTLKATFIVIGNSEAENVDLTDAKSTTEFLTKIIDKLDDIKDENGEKIEYNDKLRDRLIDVPYVRMALVAAYCTAVVDARLGN